MPTKKQTGPLLKSGANRMKRGRVSKVTKTKGNKQSDGRQSLRTVTQNVTVNVGGKSKGKSSTTIVRRAPISQQPISLSDVAKLVAEVKKTPSPSDEKSKRETRVPLGQSDEVLKSISIQTEPKSTVSISPLVSQGRLKIDENIMNKLNQSRPSIPSTADIEDKPTFKYKPISESFNKNFPVVTVPPKKDSRVKKVVIGIENRRMGEEDVLARNIEEEKKSEVARQRQQAKIDYYNREMSNMPFYEEEDIPYKPSIPEVEGIPLAEATVKEKRKYVKSGKYSKKPKAQVIEEE